MDGIELMASAMHAAKTRLDVSASNLANVSSAGFHRHVVRASFGASGIGTAESVDARAGSLKRTGRALDLAIAGRGAFAIRDPDGATHFVRSGSFFRNADGLLADERGSVLLGAHGPIVARADATIDERGFVLSNGVPVGRLRLTPNASLESGFLEASNVDAIGEMVEVLGAQRAFETAQKTLSAIDEERQKDASDVVRVKS